MIAPFTVLGAYIASQTVVLSRCSGDAWRITSGKELEYQRRYGFIVNVAALAYGFMAVALLLGPPAPPTRSWTDISSRSAS